MDAFKSFLLLSLFFFKSINDVDCGCTLSLQKDFSNPSPVFIRNKEFLAPDDSGVVSLKRSESILIGCPGKKGFVVLGNFTSSYNVLEAHCIHNTTFRVDRWTGQFSEIRCNVQPHFSTEDSGRQCNNEAKLFGVGYKIKSTFYQLYEACFNENLLTTHFVKHILSPSSQFMQVGSKRPQFIEGDLFGKVQMSKIYKVENQKERLDAILGKNMSSRYITKKQFLTRGHLAARADYTLRAETRATFHYVNAAPQWQRGNAGDWAALEDALRRHVLLLGRPVTIYTGTHSIMTLMDKRKQPQSIYLYADENNNQQVPVPLYYYKLVFDPKDKTATVFISINSSFYDAATIEELSFCSDVCEDNPKFSWLKWRSSDGTHSFCCSYEEFANEVDYLEQLDVKGLFY